LYSAAVSEGRVNLKFKFMARYIPKLEIFYALFKARYFTHYFVLGFVN